MSQFIRALSVLVFIAFSSSASAAITITPETLQDQAHYLLLSGEFEFSDEATSLVGAVAAHHPKFVIFNSPGGNIDAAMRLGRAIRALGLNTLQLRGLECASACSLAFIGGVNRFAESSSIGVHQSSFGNGSASNSAISSVQAITGNIVGYLSEMGVDPRLLQISLSVSSDDIRYLTSAEMREFHVTTDPDQATPSMATGPVRPDPQVTRSVPSPSLSAKAPDQSTDRIALFAGLDYLGRDIDMVSAPDAPSCAAQCLSRADCHAFTFNSLTRPGRGPNCFLKEAQGQLDGNSAAISGSLLRAMDVNPQAMQFGIIDPTRNIYEDMDLPGADLSRRPAPNVANPRECRLACVSNGRCAAFTFIKQKKECWLKSAVGQARGYRGAVSGTKVPMSYAPQIVDLNR